MHGRFEGPAVDRAPAAAFVEPGGTRDVRRVLGRDDVGDRDRAPPRSPCAGPSRPDRPGSPGRPASAAPTRSAPGTAPARRQRTGPAWRSCRSHRGSRAWSAAWRSSDSARSGSPARRARAGSGTAARAPRSRPRRRRPSPRAARAAAPSAARPSRRAACAPPRPRHSPRAHPGETRSRATGPDGRTATS